MRRQDREGISLLDGMKLYQEEMARRIVRRTYEYKKFVFEGFLNHIGNISLKSVTANQIISYLKTRPTNINYNRHRKEILSFLNYAKKRKMIDGNPCETIGQLPEDHAERRTPTEEEVKRVMVIARPNELILLMVLIHTLARVGEALKVMWKHVDFEGRNITLFTRKVKDGSLTPRVLPMDDTFKKFLKEVYEKRTQDVWIMRNNKTQTKFERRPKLMKSLCERAGVEPFGFYGLRHFGAVWLARHGVSMIYIQKMLGHRSLRTTEIYVGHDVEDIRSATKYLEEFSVVTSVATLPKEHHKRPQKAGLPRKNAQISVGIE